MRSGFCRELRWGLLVGLCLSCGAADKDDWPQWMGSHQTGVATAADVFPGQGELELKLDWRRPLGQGYSSISVADGRAYTLASVGEDDLLVAVNVATGQEAWRLRLDGAAIEKTSSTPAIAGGRVFALNGRGKLVAADAATGFSIWSHDLAADLGAVPPSYGMSTSPLVVDRLVAVLVGGSEAHNLVAFDQTSGEIVWSVFHAGRGSYASPVLATIGGQRQIVVPADDRLYAVRPEDGSLLWSHEGLGYLDRIPLLLPGERIFLAQERGAVMLQLRLVESGWRVEELWRSADLKDSYSPAVHHEGSIFGFDGNRLVCLDAANGKLRWRREVGQGSLILVDGHLVILDALSGQLRLARAAADGLDERARTEVFADGGSYAPPSFAEGRIFVRGASEIAALEIAR